MIHLFVGINDKILLNPMKSNISIYQMSIPIKLMLYLINIS